MFTAEKRVLTKTGIASFGWQIGYGYVRAKTKIKYEAWCVIEEGKIFAEARGERVAKDIARFLNRGGY